MAPNQRSDFFTKLVDPAAEQATKRQNEVTQKLAGKLSELIQGVLSPGNSPPATPTEVPATTAEQQDASRSAE